MQIEVVAALALIPMYNRKGTLLYVEPPYLMSTRTQEHYRPEFYKPEQHIQLLELCKQHKGDCITSSYENELYDTVLAGWEKMTIRTQTNCAHTATECIYINPVSMMQISLF